MIPEKRYKDLLNRSRMLSCLEGAGVNDWEGYTYAMHVYDNGE